MNCEFCNGPKEERGWTMGGERDVYVCPPCLNAIVSETLRSWGRVMAVREARLAKELVKHVLSATRGLEEIAREGV